MNDLLLDTLIQKISNSIKDTADVNVLIRQMTTSTEALSRVNERVDATQTAFKEIETIIKADAEKVEAVNVAIRELKTDAKTVQENIAAMQTSIGNLPERISIPHEKIDGLRKTIEDLHLQLTIPLKYELKHHHHLAKSSLLNIVFIGITMLLTFLLISAWMDNDVERGNAFKYRWLRVSLDSEQGKTLQNIDSIYEVDPAAFRKATAEKERLQKEEYEDWQKLNQEKKDVKEQEQKIRAESSSQRR
jgi:septal ring factor EnvC (AmiA/AmiB activator)